MFENKKIKHDIEDVKQQEKKKTLILVNSIDYKKGHNLYEFEYFGDHFTCAEIDLSKMRPNVTLIYKNGKWVDKDREGKQVIDIFNPDYKPEKRSVNYNYKENCVYVTALNYENACKKLKINNSHLFN